MRRHRVIVVLVFLALAAPAFAQAPRVRAFIQPTRGITDTMAIQLVVEIDGSFDGSIQAPSLAGLQNLKEIEGPTTKTSHTIVNGRQSSTYQLVYRLLANGPGPAAVPELEVRLGSTSLRTEAIRFQVEKGRRGAPGTSGGQRGRDDYDVFLVAELSDDEVWLGEPVALTVTLFTAERISNPRWRQRPTFANFWVEDEELDPDSEAYRRKINGRVYTAYPIERKILVPPSPGEYSLDPYVSEISVRRSGADLFDIFGRLQTIVRKSDPLKLRVKSLPRDEPDGFSGAVGRFDLRFSLDRTTAEVNDAVALRATVEGEGSLRSVEAPLLDVPSEVKVLDPEVSTIPNIHRGKLTSRKTWEWILVPLAPGELRVPGLEFSYFDTEKEAYRTLRGDDLVLAVERGDRTSDMPLARRGIQVQRKDLAFIKILRGELEEKHPRAHERGLFLLLLLAPVGLVPVVVLVGRHRARLARDQGLARSRRARTKARKRLQSIRKKAGTLDSASFHEGIGRTMIDYVADHVDRAATGLTYDLTDELLSARGIETDLRRRFRSCLEACDFARFVPESARAERREELLDDAGEIIDLLEKAW